MEQQRPTIDYYVWLLSDWAYLGGVRFVQLAARRGLKINYIPMRMQDVYADSGVSCLQIVRGSVRPTASQN
jgi:2-hydroxychromene-2-carboxylate isomerase